MIQLTVDFHIFKWNFIPLKGKKQNIKTQKGEDATASQVSFLFFTITKIKKIK